MHQHRKPPLLLPLAGHLAMGGLLGTLLAASLIATRANGIFDMIVNSAAPRLTTTIFIGTFAALFAVGTTLTGWIFIAMEES